MKEKMKNKYLMWGMTAFGVLAGVILFFFAIFRWNYIISFLKTIISVLMPFIYGAVIAYLLNPIVNFFELKLFAPLIQKKEGEKSRTARVLALLTSSVIFIGIIIGFFSYFLPEVFKSINMLISNMDSYLKDTKEWLLTVVGESGSIKELINSNFSSISSFITKWLNDGTLSNMVSYVSSGIYGTIKFLYNFILGYIISIYILVDKEKFKAQGKKLLYTFFSNEKVNIILENINYTDKIFGDFFSGKLIDALLVGVLCFLFMVIFDFPYALIVSVLVGVTNIIPYFGPFIGAIPSAFLIFLVNPVKSIYFLIFIFILQQLDGNIIEPKIIGSKTGLSSFWVLFSLLIFGGLFGVVGMIIGVPIFSILYSFINGLVRRKLDEKKLPLDSKDYDNLIGIDEETNELIYKK